MIFIKDNTKPPGVVKKAFTVIKAFVDVQPEWGVRDLAKYLNMPTSTLHRFIYQLQEEGIIEYNSDSSKYRIGTEMIRISSAISSNIDIIKIAKPFLKQFVDIHKETICLVLYHKKKRKIIFVDKENGPDPLQYMLNIGGFQPVPYGSSGKAIMAFLEPAEIEMICEEENLTKDQIEDLKHELEQIRICGVASTQGQRIPGAKGISSPIFNANEEPIGSLAYTVPISRFNKSLENTIAEDIKYKAMEISKILGSKQAR